MIFLVKLVTHLSMANLNWLSQCFFKKYCNFFEFDGKEC
jgi:hypothetical protein